MKTTPGQRGFACSGASELRRAPAFLPPQAGDRDDLAREKLVASGQPPRPSTSEDTGLSGVPTEVTGLLGSWVFRLC